MEVKSASTHEISVNQLKSLLTQSAARPVGVFFFVRCQGLLVAVLKLCCGILFAILSLVPLALIQWFPLCHGGSPSHQSSWTTMTNRRHGLGPKRACLKMLDTPAMAILKGT